MSTEQPRVLCVDDEQNVLDGLKRTLRRGYRVETALGPEEGLAAFEQDEPFEVVISDLRMPGMDGLEFLGRVRKTAPETTRMLLTGNADLGSAIDAVNQGSVFHFLQKPCPKDVLRAALDRAVEHNRLVSAERELLQKTLHGAVHMLTETLAIASPVIFGSAQKVAKRVRAAAERLEVPDPWKLELAALLAQAAYVTLPEGLLERLGRGEPIRVEEVPMIAKLPVVSARLLAHIPRLDDVNGWISEQGRPWGVPDEAPNPDRSIEASLLRIGLDAGILERADVPFHLVTEMLRGEPSRYWASVVEAFCGVADAENELEVREVSVREVVEGMVLLAPVEDMAGRMLLKEGQTVSASMRERLLNFSRNGNLKEPLRVGVPGEG